MERWNLKTIMTDHINIKTILHQNCLEFVNDRLQTVVNTITEIQQSLQSETKSSAGDKHETGRAMLQLEREKAGHQLAEIEKLKLVLSKINPEAKHQIIALGSLVYTTQSNYFIAISAGALTINNTLFFAISAATPIAQLLLSKKVGEDFIFRDTTIKITKVI